MTSATPPERSTQKIFLAFFFSIFLVGVSSSFAQSLGEVAREERERQEDQPRPRVYTNEDLSRSRIVAPEESAASQDAESASAAPAEPSPEPVLPRPVTIIWPSNVPLGEVARFYRRQRELEWAKESIPAPPALDLELLLPTPLASPLPDFSDKLPVPPFVPEPAWDGFDTPAETVRVERGDTLWKIAERHLGNGKDWRRIAAANPELKDPHRIVAGQQLRLPDAEVSAAARTVRVQTGDSLWKLAAAQLGTGHAWGCLAAANPQIEDANRIYPGQMLVIPTDCSSRS